MSGRESFAGGFLIPQGIGQIIAGVGYIAGSTTFTPSGKPVPSPEARKVEARGYLEYGLTDGLTIIAAPGFAHGQTGPPTPTYSGSDVSALGARLKLWAGSTQTLALQVLIEPPFGSRRTAATEIAWGGPDVFAADVSVGYGAAFTLFGRPGFVDIDPGVRLRPAGWPDQARFDATLGVRPVPRLVVLLQSFNSAAHSAGPSIPKQAYSKVQLSLVYDLSAAWSVQIGGVRTLAGLNTGRAQGPFGALWYRF